MRDTKAMKTARFFESLNRIGVDYQTADKLRLIERTLHRWSELECGDSNDYASWAIERDDYTNKPFMVRHIYNNGQMIKTPVADREAGALRRLSKIMESYPDLVFYHQTDPRGCALWLLRKSDLNGSDISANYTRGVAVCVD